MAADDPDHPDSDRSRPAVSDASSTDAEDRLPLLALDDAVCFPGTEVTVPLTDPEALRLVRELMHRPREERRAGVVLPLPDGGRDPFGRREVFPGGTVARLLDLVHRAGRRSDGEDGGDEAEPDRTAAVDGEPAEAGEPVASTEAGDEAEAASLPHAVLVGEYRFEIARQLPTTGPFREVVARPMAEARVDDGDPAVVDLRRRILDCAAQVLPELAAMVAFDADTLARLRLAEGAGGGSFEQVVNRLATDLDLPAPRKLELLLANLAERGETLLSILESRRYVLDRLRPYRHLAAHYEHN